MTCFYGIIVRKISGQVYFLSNTKLQEQKNYLIFDLMIKRNVLNENLKYGHLTNIKYQHFDLHLCTFFGLTYATLWCSPFFLCLCYLKLPFSL